MKDNYIKKSNRSDLDKEVVYLNERQQAFDKINEADRELSSKNVDVLINKAEYRIGSLINAHKFSTVANQEEVEKDVAELNQIVSELNNEIMDIENIGNRMGTDFDEPQYKEFAENIMSDVNHILSDCNDTVKRATDVLNQKFETFEIEGFGVEETTDELKEELIQENKKDDELVAAEVKTDSIEEIENDLNNELQPIQEDKKELEETKQNLDGAELVVATEPVAENTINPILQPTEPTSLDSFLNQAPVVNEEKVETPAVEEVKEVKQDVVSAASVDDGYVKVESVEEFGLENNQEQTKTEEGPTLGRRIA